MDTMRKRAGPESAVPDPAALLTATTDTAPTPPSKGTEFGD